MREILFKAKNKYTDHKWEFGSLVYDAIGQPRIAQVDKSGKGLVFHKVIAETVCQYTGLEDKNKVKVFEGDKVEKYGRVYVIKWNNLHASWGLFRELGQSIYEIVCDTTDKYGNSPKGWRDSTLLVVSNIHDKETSEIPI